MASDPTSGKSHLASLSRWTDAAQVIAKGGVAFIGTTYVIGLLVLNMHVRTFGAYYLGFLQIEYVMVGMLWIFLVGLVFCFVLYIYNQFRKGSKLIKRGKPLSTIGTIFLSIVLPVITGVGSLSFALGIFSDDQLQLHTRGFWIVTGVLAMNIVVISLLVFGVKERFGTVESSNTDRTSRMAAMFDVLYIVVFALVGLSLYSKHVFPRLSPVFGGGKRQQIQFVIKPDQLDATKSLGIPLLENSNTTPTLEMAFEAADFFLIAPPRASIGRMCAP